MLHLVKLMPYKILVILGIFYHSITTWSGSQRYKEMILIMMIRVWSFVVIVLFDQDADRGGGCGGHLRVHTGH